MMGSINAEEFLDTPKSPPNLNIPDGNTVRVSIIDSTSVLEVPLGHFMGPSLPGHEIARAPAYAFLIEHGTRRILFDLGTRKDWQNFPPAVLSIVTQPHWSIKVEKDVAQILQENGVDAANGAIEAIIWSHWHYDHIGDPSTFPGSTALLVGPGMKEALLPGYPGNPESPLLESDVAGREVKTIDFDSLSSLKIGNFRAVDFFDDGSFYLLDGPGHAIGHMCGLARVSSSSNGESTFIFLGADTAHHGAEFRPTKYLPLPRHINPSPHQAYLEFCPGHVFKAIHPNKSGNSPYYHIHKPFPFNYDQATQTLGSMQEFDAAENVFVVIAHDKSLLLEEVGVEWFPYGTLNDWKKKDLANKARWGFLRDLQQAADQMTN